MSRLNIIFASLVSFFTTAVPLAIALMGPSDSSAHAMNGSGQCELTTIQTSAIRGLAGLFNSSCTYNASITEVLMTS